MAHEGLIRRGVAQATRTALSTALGRVAVVVVSTLAFACGGHGAGTSTVASTAVVPAASSRADAEADAVARQKMPHFHSKRFDLTLHLPDGHDWRIDDHSAPELVATHAATHSTVVLFVAAESDLMSRATCEDVARARGLVPRGELRTLDDTVGLALEQFDTRIWVAIEPPPAPDAPVVGHVFAFGGFLRKCVFFHYSTQVSGTGAEADVASRLAFARTRVFGEITLDPFGEAPREPMPALTPTPQM